MAISYTTNFRLPIPEAGRTPWQTYYQELATVLDAVLGRFVAIGGFLGAWQNSTMYSVGQKLVDEDEGTVYECTVAHTSAASPDTFEEDRTARPTLWRTWSSIGTSSGVWVAGRSYAVNEFVTSGAKWAVCISAHTSGSDFDLDATAGKWSVLVDLTAYGTVTFPITVAQGGTNATSAANARTNLGLVIGTNVQAYNANLATIASYADVANLSTLQGYSNMTNLTTLQAATITAAGLELLDDANAAAQRTTLGLGTAAVLNVGTGANNIVQLDGDSKLPAIDGSALTNLPAQNAADPGDIKITARATEPSGWLFCFGQAISRTTYSDLFSAIGETYGVGDGTTTFNVPDIRGRVVAGQDDMGGSSANRLTNQSGGLNGDILGATGGAETHTLTEAQLAAHTHTYTGNTSTPGTDQGYSGSNPNTTPGSVATSSTGSGAAHNNIQPTIILNYLIKT